MSQPEFPTVNKSGNRRGMHLFKHGLARTRTHRIWCKMKERCHNPNSINFARYGGAGVTVCERWKASFEAFLYDMGECPGPEFSIERRDSRKGYFKNNCKWATVLEQSNNKRNNVVVEYQGQSKTVAQWCRDLRLNYHLVRQRIYRDKWTPERAFAR